MAQIQKGTNLRFWVGSDVLQYNGAPFFAKETSSSDSLQANTTDISSKSDENPEYDNVEFDDYEGSVSVEGNVSDVAEIKRMLRAMQGDGYVSTSAGTPCKTWCISTDGAVGGSCFAHGSEYVMTSFELDMPADGLATMSASIDLIGTINN